MSLLIVCVLSNNAFIILVDDLGLWDLVMSHFFLKVFQLRIFLLKVANLILQLLDLGGMSKLDL